MADPQMPSFQGRVRNGRLLVDQPTDLPEGTVVQLIIPDWWDDLDDADRARLHASLEQSAEDVKAGRLVPAEVVLRRLRRRR